MPTSPATFVVVNQDEEPVEGVLVSVYEYSPLTLGELVVTGTTSDTGEVYLALEEGEDFAVVAEPPDAGVSVFGPKKVTHEAGSEFDIELVYPELGSPPAGLCRVFLKITDANKQFLGVKATFHPERFQTTSTDYRVTTRSVDFIYSSPYLYADIVPNLIGRVVGLHEADILFTVPVGPTHNFLNTLALYDDATS